MLYESLWFSGGALHDRASIPDRTPDSSVRHRIHIVSGTPQIAYQINIQDKFQMIKSAERDAGYWPVSSFVVKIKWSLVSTPRQQIKIPAATNLEYAGRK